MPARVAYVSSPTLLNAADLLPSNRGRASLVHELIRGYGLLPSNEQDDGYATRREEGHNTVIEIDSIPANRTDLLQFHEDDFIDALLGRDCSASSNNSDTSSDEDLPIKRSFGITTDERAVKRRKVNHAVKEEAEEEEYGLESDCPLFQGLADYVLEVAGASITAARELREGRADIAIAWTGGRHHGKRAEAAGFCYVNDIVLAILEVKKPSATTTTKDRIKRVMYLDLDLHHGDGVAVAFAETPSVLTLSIHLLAPLFYPSTGALNSTGPTLSNASYHDLNLASHEGLSSTSLIRLYHSCIAPILEVYDPQAIVIQCGADGLNEDPCGEWNLSLDGVATVLQNILDWRRCREKERKVLLLGGGGYHSANTARSWTYLTSIALGRPIPVDTPIPASIESYALFAPALVLNVEAGNRVDKNTEVKLVEIETAFAGYIDRLKDKYEKKS